MLDDTLYNTQEILDLLTPEQIDTDRFFGQSHFMGSPNVFGGQVLGQSLYAACKTVSNRRPHSLHSLFILPGNHQLPITFEVEPPTASEMAISTERSPGVGGSATRFTV